MKRYISLIFILLCLTTNAQETVIRSENTEQLLLEIEEANNSLSGFQGHFTQVKSFLANNRKVNSEGSLYHSKGKLAMIYSQPETDRFIINGERMYMVRGKKESRYDLNVNKPMKKLASTLLYSMQGQIRQLALENNANVTARKAGGFTVVTLTANEKSSKGYSLIELYYGSDHVLHSMDMVEFNGNSTLYTMTDLQRNPIIDESVYLID